MSKAAGGSKAAGPKSLKLPRFPKGSRPVSRLKGPVSKAMQSPDMLSYYQSSSQDEPQLVACYRKGEPSKPSVASLSKDVCYRKGEPSKPSVASLLKDVKDRDCEIAELKKQIAAQEGVITDLQAGQESNRVRLENQIKSLESILQEFQSKTEQMGQESKSLEKGSAEDTLEGTLESSVKLEGGGGGSSVSFTSDLLSIDPQHEKSPVQSSYFQDTVSRTTADIEGVMVELGIPDEDRESIASFFQELSKQFGGQARAEEMVHHYTTALTRSFHQLKDHQQVRLKDQQQVSNVIKAWQGQVVKRRAERVLLKTHFRRRQTETLRSLFGHSHEFSSKEFMDRRLLQRFVSKNVERDTRKVFGYWVAQTKQSLHEKELQETRSALEGGGESLTYDSLASLLKSHASEFSDVTVSKESVSLFRQLQDQLGRDVAAASASVEAGLESVDIVAKLNEITRMFDAGVETDFLKVFQDIDALMKACESSDVALTDESVLGALRELAKKLGMEPVGADYFKSYQEGSDTEVALNHALDLIKDSAFQKLPADSEL